MQAPASRRKLTISMVMVVIAFLAISIAGGVASYRDRNRPDFMLAIWCLFAGGMAANEFSYRTGRALAGTWIENLVVLGFFLVGEIWMGLVFTPLPVDRSVFAQLAWNYWPSLVAFPAGVAGRYLGRWRYDRVHGRM